MSDLSGGIELTIGHVAFELRLPSWPMIDIVAQRVAKSSRGGLFTAPHLLLITFPDGRPDGELSVRIEHSALSAALEIPLPDQLLELRIRARYPASCSGGRRSAADLGRLRWWRPHPGSCELLDLARTAID